MEVDRGREVRRVAETAGLPLDAHDLAVEVFCHTARDWMLDEAEQAIEMRLQGGGDRLDRLEPRAHGPGIPTGDESFHGRGLAACPQRPQRFLGGWPWRGTAECWIYTHANSGWFPLSLVGNRPPRSSCGSRRQEGRLLHVLILPSGRRPDSA